MGGRIEIPLKEYNSFQDVKAKLENTINNLSKENAILKEKYAVLTEMIWDVREASISERLLKWETLWKPIMLELNEPTEERSKQPQ